MTTLDPQVAASLIRAVAHGNTWKRGKKERMECWKDLFGIYINVRYKYPRISIEGRRWRADYTIVEIYGSVKKNGQWTYIEVGDRFNETVILTLPGYGERCLDMEWEALNGDPDAFVNEMTILRLFESEWHTVEAFKVS